MITSRSSNPAKRASTQHCGDVFDFRKAQHAFNMSVTLIAYHNGPVDTCRARFWRSGNGFADQALDVAGKQQGSILDDGQTFLDFE